MYAMVPWYRTTPSPRVFAAVVTTAARFTVVFTCAAAIQVGGLKREIGSLKSLVQQMSTEQSATLMAIVQQMRAPQQQSKPAEPSLNKS